MAEWIRDYHDLAVGSFETVVSNLESEYEKVRDEVRADHRWLTLHPIAYFGLGFIACAVVLLLVKLF